MPTKSPSSIWHTHRVQDAENWGLDKRYLADAVGRVIEGEIAAGPVNSCGFHSNTCIPEVAFKAVSFSAKVSFSFWILDLFPHIFSVSISPSLCYRVSVTSFPKTLKKTQVFPIWNVSPFPSTFPEATALSPPPHTQSFPEIFYPCSLHMLPSHSLLNSLHSVFHPHYKLQKASVSIRWPLCR